jgi:hypothetical protein
MTKIVADELLRTRLNNLSEGLEIWDAHGNVLGFFVPAEAPKEMYEQMQWPEYLTPTEIERLLQQKGGKSLTQIWQELGRP